MRVARFLLFFLALTGCNRDKSACLDDGNTQACARLCQNDVGAREACAKLELRAMDACAREDWEACGEVCTLLGTGNDACRKVVQRMNQYCMGPIIAGRPPPLAACRRACGIENGIACQRLEALQSQQPGR